MEEIYVLLVNNKTTELDEHDIMVFDNLELAKLNLNILKERFLKEIEDNIDDYTIDDNSDDEFLASFSAYEAGFYDQNHFDLIIYQRELNCGV